MAQMVIVKVGGVFFHLLVFFHKFIVQIGNRIFYYLLFLELVVLSNPVVFLTSCCRG